MKRWKPRNKVTVNIFAYATKGERRETCSSHCQILRFRSREALSTFRQCKVLSQAIFVATEGVVLLHNARLHVSRVTYVELATFKWKQLDHPLYYPNMLSCGFHVFNGQKKIPEKTPSSCHASSRTTNSRML
ncbi:hypothetical protein TNIN_83791 [Trichonephila inaurata madagascariensis]|uniref:Uncharacterized protein n=1 Tax=Trichonephila inaurata madagascariensis TaxID=2747483 RepID=A0A8X6XTR1_9ARAC|nr:hypothetical protein TNIN_83791 [Trichonephila inaurata madagascariensis]